MHKILFMAFATFLTGAAAHADDAHIPLPGTKPVAGNIAGGGLCPLGGTAPPDSCCANRALLEVWLRDWRQRARQSYAENIAQSIPKLGITSPVKGASCINKPESFDAQYEPKGDFFILTCLAHTGDKLTHVFRLDLNLQLNPTCLSDAMIHAWAVSPKCTIPGGGLNYVMRELTPCSKTPVPVQFRGDPVAYSVDIDYFNKLINTKPSIQTIVDEDRKVKGGVGPTPPVHTGGAKPRNPLGDEPPADSAE